MKHLSFTESLKTTSRSEMLEITAKVQQRISIERIVEGMAIVYVPHTTPFTTTLTVNMAY